MKQTNIKNYIRRKNSWKSALNLRLPTDTVCNQYRQFRRAKTSTRNLMTLSTGAVMLRTILYATKQIRLPSLQAKHPKSQAMRLNIPGRNKIVRNNTATLPFLHDQNVVHLETEHGTLTSILLSPVIFKW